MINKLLIIPNAEITKYKTSLWVENGTGEFASDLVNLGYEVTFFGQIIDEENSIHNFNLSNYPIAVKGLLRRKNKVSNYILLYLFSIIQIIKADFVYIFYPSSFKYIAFLCKILGKKYGLYIRGMQDLKSSSSKIILKNSSLILCVSDNFKEYVEEISNSVYCRTIRPMIPFFEKDIVKDRVFRKSQDFYRILYLGRMTNDKGIIELLHAISELRNPSSIFELNLVGDGEYMEQLLQLAEELEINDVVSFKGATFNLETIKQFYLESDLYILPSYHEGFPRTLYEAMIFGVPIITTFVGGIGAVMKENKNCLKIIPKSVESIVKVLGFAMNNFEELEVLTKNATIDIQEIFETRKLSHAMELSVFLKEVR